MNLALWIVTGLLAAVYFFGGGGKVVMPKKKLAAATASAQWVDDFSARSVTVIGALEVLGALGLVLPALFDVATFLVPIAAIGLLLIMIGAVITRLRRQEHKLMGVDLTYVLLLIFVIWGRLGTESFSG
ncbi:DoxX family protein [Blastococcus xanthinilyticus]|uniref:DoxX-like protein n=1 Tax=Blastococcus xanthinilyticus TaxID=1564164 RepID=A0A5S5CUR6_9ACTN|nr:DoxX family protein [Blastococcus xanthinilyticus]TYP86738.1 DoxX-like protein [Blastococcus xanthinilyticus]